MDGFSEISPLSHRAFSLQLIEKFNFFSWKYTSLGDGPVGGRKVPTAPKAPAPVTLLDLWELALDFVRRSPLHQPHQIADRLLRRDRYKHVDVVVRQHAFDDLNSVLSADLPTDSNMLTPACRNRIQ